MSHVPIIITHCACLYVPDSCFLMRLSYVLWLTFGYHVFLSCWHVCCCIWLYLALLAGRRWTIGLLYVCVCVYFILLFFMWILITNGCKCFQAIAMPREFLLNKVPFPLPVPFMFNLDQILALTKDTVVSENGEFSFGLLFFLHICFLKFSFLSLCFGKL